MSPVERASGGVQPASGHNEMTTPGSTPAATVQPAPLSVRPNPNLGMGTKSVHLGHGADPLTGAIMPPINLSTTFVQRAPGVPISRFEYSRSDNPTRNTLEQAIAYLEGGKHGIAFSSGSAATTAIGMLLEPGAHILCVNDCYGGTRRLFTKVLTHFGVEVTYVPLRPYGDQRAPPASMDMPLLRSLFKPSTRLVWIETPTNPNLHLVDIKAVSELAHTQRPDMLVVVDNTFMTPLLQQPLALGADVVAHSATKYINGHADVLMGLLVANDDALAERLRFYQNAVGAVPSPFDCYLMMRGLRTLHLRMERHCRNAQQIAVFLANHPCIKSVIYPGLPSHPDHELAKRQCRGFGGMVSFRLRDDSLAAACRFSQATRVFTLAESLGGVESLIDVPAVMTHGGVPPAERRELGITDGFIRLSVGIEDAEDLIADIKRALEAIPSKDK